MHHTLAKRLPVNTKGKAKDFDFRLLRNRARRVGHSSRVALRHLQASRRVRSGFPTHIDVFSLTDVSMNKCRETQGMVRPAYRRIDGSNGCL